MTAMGMELRLRGYSPSSRNDTAYLPWQICGIKNGWGAESDSERTTLPLRAIYLNVWLGFRIGGAIRAG